MTSGADDHLRALRASSGYNRLCLRAWPCGALAEDSNPTGVKDVKASPTYYSRLRGVNLSCASMRCKAYENTRHSGGIGCPPANCRSVVHGGHHVSGCGALRRRVGFIGRALETGLEGGGVGALAAKPQPAARCRLSDEQKAQLVEILLRGPLAAGYFTDLWTCARLAQVIHKEFGVTYHVDHVGCILHDLGFTPQKPRRKARERDEAAIERWRRHDWPRIKKGDRGGKLVPFPVRQFRAVAKRRDGFVGRVSRVV